MSGPTVCYRCGHLVTAHQLVMGGPRPCAECACIAIGYQGPGRPATGERVEVRLPPEVLAAVDAEAAELGWKRAELLRWIVAERYESLKLLHPLVPAE
jgi:hypothetical protein